MPDKILKTRIKLKGDTDSKFSELNPILLKNEVINVHMDDGEIRQKIGNGSTRYKDLPWSKPLSDYSENNPLALSHIKNRPFWYEYKPPVVEDKTYTFNAEDADIAEGEHFAIFLNERINLIAGKEYEVSLTLFSGVQKTVKVVAVDVYYEAPEIVGERNTLIGLTAESEQDAPPEEEFGFTICDGGKQRIEDGGFDIGNYTTVYCGNIQSISLTTSKSIDKSVYHQIDPKFVPNLPYEEVKQEEEILTFKFSDSTVEDFGTDSHIIVLDAPIGLVNGKMYRSIETDNATSTQTTYNFPAIEAEPEAYPGVIVYGFSPNGTTTTNVFIYDHCDIDMTVGDIVPGDKAFILFDGDYNLDLYLSEKESTVHKLDERFYDKTVLNYGNKQFDNKTIDINISTESDGTITATPVPYIGLVPNGQYKLTYYLNGVKEELNAYAQRTENTGIFTVPCVRAVFNRPNTGTFVTIETVFIDEIIEKLSASFPGSDLPFELEALMSAVPVGYYETNIEINKTDEVESFYSIDLTGDVNYYIPMLYRTSIIPELKTLAEQSNGLDEGLRSLKNDYEDFKREQEELLNKEKEERQLADVAAFIKVADATNYFYGREMPDFGELYGSSYVYIAAEKMNRCFYRPPYVTNQTFEDFRFNLLNIKSIPDSRPSSSYNQDSAFYDLGVKSLRLKFNHDIQLYSRAFFDTTMDFLILDSDKEITLTFSSSEEKSFYLPYLESFYIEGNVKIDGDLVDFSECGKLKNFDFVNALTDHSTEENPGEHTLRLHANAKALLTDSQKTQITAKGWTLE